MDAGEAVLRFLESTGRPGEAKFYLELFRAEAKERFATISVSAQVAKLALDAVIVDLRFLATLGLTPVVVLGLIEPGEADEHASRVRRRLERTGVPAVVLPDDPEDLPVRAAEAARRGVIPVIPFDAKDGSTLEQRYDRLTRLLAELRSRKLIFVRRSGALQGRSGPFDIVNLSTEYEAVAAELPRKQQQILAQCRRVIFEGVSHKLTVTFTSPIDLLRELFTTRGAGTLLRRGAVVEVRRGFAEVDQPRLARLLESAFGRPPVDAFFTRPVTHIFLEDAYRGAAIVARTPELGGYLTKFAVEREAQGEGIGRDLWEKMIAEYPTVFWRARPQNPIGAWYEKQCDGLCRFPEWHVYWRGLAPEKIPAAIQHALAAPVDILAPAAVPE
jgi:acetylglutamate kinase